MQSDRPNFPDLRIQDAVRSHWKIGLIALALMLGFAVGARLGSGSGSGDPLPPTSETTALADETPAALPAFVLAEDPLEGWRAGAETASSRESTEEDLQGKVVARYASVAIDALPMHDAELEPPDSLTLVTRGRIRSGESLASSLQSRGISPATVHLIASEMSDIFDFRGSRPGDRPWALNPGPRGARPRAAPAAGGGAAAAVGPALRLGDRRDRPRNATGHR